MRTDIPAGMAQVWRSGDFTGANKPIARLTIQQANINLYDFEFATNGQGATATTSTGTGSGVPLDAIGIAHSTSGSDIAAATVGSSDSEYASFSNFGSASAPLPGVSLTTGVTSTTTSQQRQSSGTVHETYSSLIFGSTFVPRELPNVASVQWQRGVSQDFATATFKFYNTAPMPIGTVPTRDLDMLGYYTYNRGITTYSNRWCTTPNEWSGFLMPDNIIRTYEGYGFSANDIPENDPHLMQTGVWMIDKVEYDAKGVITVSARDVGRILGDQIIFVPVVPADFYPVQFGASSAHVGLTAPITYTYTVDSLGNQDPNHTPPPDWSGPFDSPTIYSVVAGNDSISVTFRAITGVTYPATDWSNWDGGVGTMSGVPPAYGYDIACYKIVLDGIVLPTQYVVGSSWYSFINGPQSAVDNHDGTYTVQVPGLEIQNGNTYDVAVIAVYTELLTAQGEIYYKTNIERQQDSDYSNDFMVSPGVPGAPVASNIALNINMSGTLAPNVVTWDVADGGHDATWTLTVYSNDYTEIHTYTVSTTAGATKASIDTSTDELGDLGDWNYVVWGVSTVGTGAGAIFFDSSGGAFWLPPRDGVPPHDPGPAPTAPTVTTTTTTSSGTTTQTSGLSNNETDIKYNDSSNIFPLIHTVVSGDTLWDLSAKYLGPSDKYDAIYQLNKALIERVAIKHGFSSSDHGHWIFPGEKLKIPGVYGHTPSDAFDDSSASYWLSDGHTRSDLASCHEWIEGSLGGVMLTAIDINAYKKNYYVHVSVYARGVWVKHNDQDIIPYKPESGEENNGARIPFCEAVHMDDTDTVRVTFRSPIPGAQKVRLTFSNLQSFSEYGDFRAAVQNVKAYAQVGNGDSSTSGSGSKTTTQTTVTPAPVVQGPPQDDNDPIIVKSYTDYVPAHFDIGAGANPGQYQDYTDIVKLFCAWGGFFWPENAAIVQSDGSFVSYDFGLTDYGLENVDPVLGGEGSGRCWGDFEQTGTNGPATITVDNWDKKSLMDGIGVVRDVIGFIFLIDETGGVVWRNPNIYSVGNWLSAGSTSTPGGTSGARTSTIIEIDETQTLIGLTATLDSTNVRERIFVATTAGNIGALAVGWNPNPIGLRRVAGWTDQHFQSDAECQVMADLIALQQLFLYRTDQITIPGYPAIQVDDQVRIFEQVTGEGYIHYVSSITSNLDMEQGQWTYQLDTNWLGEDPGEFWLFDVGNLSAETQAYLTALTIPAGTGIVSDV